MSTPPERPSVCELARMIDHSLLHPTLSDLQLRAGLEIARKCACASACVKPYAVPMAAAFLASSGVAVCAVAGFPHGNSHLQIKVSEADRALAEGASEIDCVVNVGKVLSHDWRYVEAEINAVNQTCVPRGALLKLIFENDYLGDREIIRLCQICTELGVAFVKTSTGYGFVKQPDGAYHYRGATDAQLRLMRQHAGPAVQVKAAGGIRSLDDVLRVRALGATRIGATATEAILGQAVKDGFPGPLPPAFETVKPPVSAPGPEAGY